MVRDAEEMTCAKLLLSSCINKLEERNKHLSMIRLDVIHHKCLIAVRSSFQEDELSVILLTFSILVMHKLVEIFDKFAKTDDAQDISYI